LRAQCKKNHSNIRELSGSLFLQAGWRIIGQKTLCCNCGVFFFFLLCKEEEEEEASLRRQSFVSDPSDHFGS
jgi:hypothetical protein